MNKPKSKIRAFLLNLILPGWGHVFWKDYMFGVFIYLIMLIAIVLFFVSFLITDNKLLIRALGLLPILFYLFTFIDLSKTVKTKKVVPSTKKFFIFLVIGLAYQVFVPIAPVNFIIRNAPDYFFVEKNNLSPLYAKGDLLKADKSAYIVDLFFFEKPLMHTMPQRYEIVRFNKPNGGKDVGIIVGLPGEDIEINEGVVIVNGYPDYREPKSGFVLMGDCGLTRVDDFSILVATFNLGVIDTVYNVPFNDLIGKVDKAF